MITLQKGAVYKSRHNGMVEYIGLDRFCGETTHQFRRLTYGGMTYIQPEQLDEFLAPQETLETIKQQRDDLLAAQQDHQRLVRQLDVLLNGEAGAAQQASLCDLVAQVAKSGVVSRSGAAPEGWQLEELDNDCIAVRKEGVGFYVASFNGENIASTILHALASDMLAAAHEMEGGAS